MKSRGFREFSFVTFTYESNSNSKKSRGSRLERCWFDRLARTREMTWIHWNSLAFFSIWLKFRSIRFCRRPLDWDALLLIIRIWFNCSSWLNFVHQNYCFERTDTKFANNTNDWIQWILHLIYFAFMKVRWNFHVDLINKCHDYPLVLPKLRSY